MVNTVLCSIFADSSAEMSKQIEGGKKPAEVAIGFLKEHWKCIMNGDNYSADWPIEADKRGVWRIDSGVEAMTRILLTLTQTQTRTRTRTRTLTLTRR